MPLYVKTAGGWKLGVLGWERRAAGWTLANPLAVKNGNGVYERLLPWGTMLAPSITSPANWGVWRVGTGITVGVSAISSTGFADTGAGTQIQIAWDAGFTNVPWAYNGGYTTSWALGGWNTAGTFYVRARHCGAVLGWGPWSAATAFVIQPAVAAGIASSGTWTAPYDGTYSIFVCGGGGGGGGGGFRTNSQYAYSNYGGYAGGDSRVYTVSGTWVDISASGGAGGGGAAYVEDISDGDNPGTRFQNGGKGANSSAFTGGRGGSVDYSGDGYAYAAGGNGGGGAGSSPYGLGGAGVGRKDWPGATLIGIGQGGNGGNGATNSTSVWLARGTVLQIIIGGGGGGGEGGHSGAYSGGAGSAGVVYING